MDSAKVVDFHVSYSSQEGFGYSGAVGCPAFSSSAVVVSGPPEVEELGGDGGPAGFAVIQDYRHPLWPAPCNYHYVQRFEFYADGASVWWYPTWRGCGNDGTYRPIVRIDPAGDDQTIAAGTAPRGSLGKQSDGWRRKGPRSLLTVFCSGSATLTAAATSSSRATVNSPTNGVTMHSST
ncbi:MAG: hypothetical protein R2851_20505 [Caldilineaceae bacterium]